MKKLFILSSFVFFYFYSHAQEMKSTLLQVKVANGLLESVSESGVSVFKGVPFAKPPQLCAT